MFLLEKEFYRIERKTTEFSSEESNESELFLRDFRLLNRFVGS